MAACTARAGHGPAAVISYASRSRYCPPRGFGSHSFRRGRAVELFHGGPDAERSQTSRPRRDDDRRRRCDRLCCWTSPTSPRSAGLQARLCARLFFALCAHLFFAFSSCLMSERTARRSSKARFADRRTTAACAQSAACAHLFFAQVIADTVPIQRLDGWCFGSGPVEFARCCSAAPTGSAPDDGAAAAPLHVAEWRSPRCAGAVGAATPSPQLFQAAGPPPPPQLQSCLLQIMRD